MTVRPERSISRARAVSCALVNLAATPGLGSLMGRRIIAGTGQLLLALAGFVLIVGWIFEWSHRIYLQQLGEPVPPDSSGWMGKWGLICFIASWLWSLITSLGLLWQATKAEPDGSKPVPPRLPDSPGPPLKL